MKICSIQICLASLVLRLGAALHLRASSMKYLDSSMKTNSETVPVEVVSSVLCDLINSNSGPFNDNNNDNYGGNYYYDDHNGNSTGGVSHSGLKNFLADDSCGEWTCCDNLSPVDYCSWSGITCDGDIITDLYLSYSSGTLPDSIGNLTSLISLDIEGVCYGSIPNIYTLVNLEHLALNSYFTGSISADIGLLANLRRLRIEAPLLGGSLPDSICGLTDLESLELMYSPFTGTLPAELGRLVNLATLDIERCYFTGTLPSLNYPVLENLIIYFTQLSGPLPSMMLPTVSLASFSNNYFTHLPDEISLPEIEILGIDNNFLSGSLPGAFNNMTRLLSLEGSYNFFSGPLPTFEHSYLEYLDLGQNFFTGTVPPLPVSNAINLDNNELRGRLPEFEETLSVLYLSNNLLQGELSALPTMLTGLYLSNNLFTGNIEVLFQFAQIWYVDLSNNYFTGTLSLSPLPHLQILLMGGNYLSGTIPSSLSSSTYLSDLDLSDNFMSGTISSSVAESRYTEYVNLSSNFLTGTLPSSFNGLESLKYLDISFNALNGSISDALASQNLNTLNVQFNGFSGSLPKIVGTVYVANLSHNQFTGDVVITPYSDGRIYTASLDVSNNFFNGNLSSTLCGAFQLYQLFVTNNDFDSDVCYPGCLQLVSEDFYSVIPRCYDAEVAAMCELGSTLNIAAKQMGTSYTDSVYIESPHYTGDYFDDGVTLKYPGAYAYQISFSKLTQINGYVQFLWGEAFENNLGYGRFASEQYPGVNGVPPLLIYTDTLKISNSVTCNFYGYSMTISVLFNGRGWSCTESNNNQLMAFPCSWSGVSCVFGQITSISLSGLYLSGTIPPSIFNLTSLTSLDLSFNSLKGTIPSPSSYVSLSSLDLSSNSLTGTIPEQLFNLVALTSLSLANNKLHGTIPSVFAGMTFLSTLRLDANQLTGKLTNEMCVMVENRRTLSVINTLIGCYESCWDEFVDDPTIFSHDPDLHFCAPSSSPSGVPSSVPTTFMPSMQPTPSSAALSTRMVIIIAVSGSAGLLLLCASACGIFYTQFRSKVMPSVEDVELQKMLKSNPLHKAIIERKHLGMDFVAQNIATSSNKTPDNKTALDLILDAGTKYIVDIIIVFMLLEHLLPNEMKSNLNAEECMNGNSAWCRIIQLDDDRSVEVVSRVLSKYKSYVGLLANALDPFGRKYINIASAKCKVAINRVLYLHERYELFEGPPEYKTKGSLIRFAYDHKRQRRASDYQNTNANRKVALKFISSAASFKKEVNNRAINQADNAKYFITVLESYDGDSHDPEQKAFRTDALIKGYEDYPYCIVMEAADQNLNRYMNSQRIAGHEWEEIRRIFKQLMTCIEYLHCHEVIHGDIKPNNVVLMGSAGLRLIDFDNSVKFFSLTSGTKSSTAYCPPEFFRIQDDSGGRKKLISKNEEVEMFEMNPSHDIWSLGAVLYLLCTGVNLFLGNLDDAITDEEDLMTLYQWDDAVRDRKLSKITDKLARNLVSLMLTKDAERRIDALRVLDHPFLSGKQVARLAGEESEFDVFISYRVSSDAYHANLLYTALTARGLKVWLDSKCLESGKNWEIGFCEGLFKSDYFVCLVSKDAVVNPKADNMNWSKLATHSPCDNVLLEWMLALELKQRELLKGVFPVFIGSTKNERTYDKFYVSGRDVSDVSVTSIEDKLRMHLDRQGCGLPYNMNYSVRSVMTEVTSNQGTFLTGELDEAVVEIVNKVEGMVRSGVKYGTPSVKMTRTGSMRMSQTTVVTPTHTKEGLDDSRSRVRDYQISFAPSDTVIEFSKDNQEGSEFDDVDDDDVPSVVFDEEDGEEHFFFHSSSSKKSHALSLEEEIERKMKLFMAHS